MAKRSVRRPYERIKANVCNQSSRAFAPRLIVLHSTESHNRPGNADLEAIVSWFDNPASQASSHVVVDDEGRSAGCVPDAQKAWTQAYWNPFSLSIEMIGFASQSKIAWLVNNRAQILKTAKYIAYWSKEHNIPIQKGAVNNTTGLVTKAGVVTHNSLGQKGGGHHDPGPNFPSTATLTAAKWYRRFGWK